MIYPIYIKLLGDQYIQTRTCSVSCLNSNIPKNTSLFAISLKQVLKKNGGGGGGGHKKKNKKKKKKGGFACKIGEYILDHEMYNSRNSKFSTKF